MKRFQEVEPGIFRGSCPTPQELATLKNVLGVKRIVSLDLDVGEELALVCKELGLEQLIIPLEYKGSNSEPRLKKAFKLLGNHVEKVLQDNQPTFVHCVHGRDRTGFVIALYRIIHNNWSYEDAINEAKSLDYGDGMSKDLYNLCDIELEKASKQDSNENDIVDLARNTLNSYMLSEPIDGITSYSPVYSRDFIAGDPMNSGRRPTDVHQIDDEERKSNREKRLQDMNDAMAFVGMNDNVNPVLRGLSPIGIGPLGAAPYATNYL